MSKGPANKGTKDERMDAIRTIQKLLAVARSVPNEPQGKTARTLAQRRMTEWGLTEAEVDAVAVEEEQQRGTLLPWEEQVWRGVRTATVALGRDPMDFFEDLLVRLWAVNEKEEVRLRAFYLGRCGRRYDIACMLGAMHFKQYERVWEEAVVQGSLLALQGQAPLPGPNSTRYDWLPPAIDSVYGRVGPIPLPQGIVGWLINNRETPEEAGPHVVAAWQKYLIEVNAKEAARAVHVGLPKPTSGPQVSGGGTPQIGGPV